MGKSTIKADKVLLWTNSNSATGFSAQTIQLDLSNYSQIQIVFRGHAAYNWYTVYTVPQKILVFAAHDLTAVGFTGNPTWHATRGVSFTDTGITFTQGLSAGTTVSMTADNSCMIPYQIYGIK